MTWDPIGDVDRFIIIGPARYGKTTFAEAFAKALGVRHMDTSTPLVEIETARIVALGIKGETWDWERDRPNRAHLVATGDAMQRLSPTVFVDACFRRAAICSGVRRKTELDAACALYQPTVIYVDRPGYPRDPEDNFDIEYEDWMVKVSATSVAGLQEAAVRLSWNFREVP